MTLPYSQSIIIQEGSLANVNNHIENLINHITNSNKGFKYLDLVLLDPRKEKINKGKLEEVFEKFSKYAISQEGKKIYVIFNIELLSIQTIQSLLSSIEEPIDNTFAILTTKDISRIPKTIISRCQLYKIGFDETSKILLKNKTSLTDEQIDIAKHIYSDINDLITNEAIFQNYLKVCRPLVSTKKKLDAFVLFKDLINSVEQGELIKIVKILYYLSKNIGIAKIINK